MAEVLRPGGDDRLHHFVAAGVWATRSLEVTELLSRLLAVGGRDAVLVIDDGDAEQGQAFGRCRSAICFGAGQRPPTVRRWIGA